MNDETKYLNAMFQAKVMLYKGLISDKEYQKIEINMAKKYHQNKTSLYRLNDLINNRFRAIYMIPNKEVQNGSWNNRKESNNA